MLKFPLRTPFVWFFLSFLFLEAGKCIAQAPDWLWAKTLSGNYFNMGTNIAVDSDGNIYAAGIFRGDTISFGIFTLINDTTDSTYDIFLVKYDMYGNVLWARSAKGDGSDYVNGIAVDKSGSVYLAGYFSGDRIYFETLYLNSSDTIYHSENLYIVKYDSLGTPIWLRGAISTGSAHVGDITLDENANIYITGTFFSVDLSFDSITLNVQLGHPSIYFAKFDSAGNAIMARNTQGTFNMHGIDVTVDSLHNIYITGFFQDTVLIFGNDTLRNAGSGAGGADDVYLVKYDSSGNIEWARSAGGRESERPASIASDRNGNTYITGFSLSDTVWFGAISLMDTMGNNIYNTFLGRYDTNGNIVWAKGLEDEQYNQGNCVTVDNSGYIYLSGYYEGDSIKFDSVALSRTYNNGSDIYIFQCDSLGNVYWGKSAGGTSASVYVKSMAIDSENNLILTGHYMDSCIFGNTILHRQGYHYSFFVAKLGMLNTNVASEILEDDIILYPNPTRNNFMIKNPSTDNFNVIGVLSPLGNFFPVKEVKGEGSHFSIDDLVQGIYFVLISFKEKIVVKKLVIN